MDRRIVVGLAGAALLFATACEPSKTPPVNVMAMVISPLGKYEPRQVTLQTLTDVVGLRGGAAHLVGGARIVDDPSEPARNNDQLTEQQLMDLMLKAPGTRPKASYVEKEGTLWPADFHTWNETTIYFNFEKASDYFKDNGVATSEILDPTTGDGPTVYYWAEFTEAAISDQPLKDNALFFPPVQAFMTLPFQDLQTVPLAMNSGIIAHEFSHRVFNRRAYGGASIPLPFVKWFGTGFPTTPINILKSIDEGLADFHAFGASCAMPFGCNTRFLEPSLGAPTANARDMSAAGRCVDQPLRNAISTLSVGDYSAQGLDYRLGTILAAALYRASYPSKLQTMQRAVISAYADQDATKPGLFELINLNAETPANFSLAAVATSILQHISDPQLKIDTCNNFIDMLQIPKADMLAPAGQVTACPPASSNPGSCPQLP